MNAVVNRFAPPLEQLGYYTGRVGDASMESLLTVYSLQSSVNIVPSPARIQSFDAETSQKLQIMQMRKWF